MGQNRILFHTMSSNSLKSVLQLPLDRDVLGAPVDWHSSATLQPWWKASRGKSHCTLHATTLTGIWPTYVGDKMGLCKETHLGPMVPLRCHRGAQLPLQQSHRQLHQQSHQQLHHCRQNDCRLRLRSEFHVVLQRWQFRRQRRRRPLLILRVHCMADTSLGLTSFSSSSSSFSSSTSSSFFSS